jgi:hypothetical protein
MENPGSRASTSDTMEQSPKSNGLAIAERLDTYKREVLPEADLLVDIEQQKLRAGESNALQWSMAVRQARETYLTYFDWRVQQLNTWRSLQLLAP